MSEDCPLVPSRREQKAQEYSKNKAAFDEVIGDPFALEPIEGAYLRFKRRAQIKIQHINDLGHGTVNPARPLINDFFCDVENIIAEVITDPDRLDEFWDTYLYEEPVLTTAQRNYLEQRLGKKFWVRGLIPVKNYFIAVKRRKH
jgi:hypothetical protein